MLEVGTKAPEFTLQAGDGSSVSLSDLAGRTVVLYFCPKYNTYVIDGSGVIRNVLPKVKPDTNAREVLELLG